MYKLEDDDNNQANNGLDKILNGISSIDFNKKFLENRSIFLWGAVMDDTAEQVVNRLLYLEMKNPGKPITFFINSPGGSVTAGMAILDTMKLISSPVKTVCMGLCASMASILLSAGEKGSRTILPHAEVMIHQPSIGGYFQDKASNLEIHAIQIAKTKKITAEILSQNCGQTFDKVMADIENDHWMDANESLQYGIVDKIADKLEF
ncbi:MAG: ATP-dependent Clp protease proteolytic subunit [Bacteroidales bacterium]|nr:ATP-dependent Clp protease proteolytic subunit [Bacteroidales bacterium]